MADPIKLFIDLKDADSDVFKEVELNEMAELLAEEVKAGRLVHSAELTRKEEIPDRAMSGLAGLVSGLVTAVVLPELLTRLVDFLLKRFKPETMRFSWTDGDKSITFDYTTKEDFERKLHAAKELFNFHIKIIV